MSARTLVKGWRRKARILLLKLQPRQQRRHHHLPLQRMISLLKRQKPLRIMKPAVVVSAALVKQLRDETGAGMTDCKKALAETDGDLQKAQEARSSSGRRACHLQTRNAGEGLIGSYIHDNRIGCMIEVNSETDFVARNERFKELVNDLAMQGVACPQVDNVSVEDIPESVVNKELEMQRKDLQSKPEN
ncbi:hypothetical protein ACP4OV_028042 [Aristida adscensionis]